MTDEGLCALARAGCGRVLTSLHLGSENISLRLRVWGGQVVCDGWFCLCTCVQAQRRAFQTEDCAHLPRRGAAESWQRWCWKVRAFRCLLLNRG